MRKITQAYHKMQKSFNQSINHKLLHKVGKQWLVISTSLLVLVSGTSLITHASNVKANQVSHTPVVRQANNLHHQIINHANNRVVTYARRPTRRHARRYHRSHFNGNFKNVYFGKMPHNKSHLILPKSSFNNMKYRHKITDDQFSDFDINDNYKSTSQANVEKKTHYAGYKLDKVYNPYNPSDEGYVFPEELSHSKHHTLNYKRISGKVMRFLNAINTKQMHQFHFTHNQINHVNKMNRQYRKLQNADGRIRHIYSVRPNLKKHRVGKLSYAYRKSIINWINFYRSQYNLPPVTEDTNLSRKAQYGADDCKVGGDIEHGLYGLHKPKYVSHYAWNMGKSATMSSNLNEDDESPLRTINDYYTDEQTDNVPGHRAWLLDANLKKVGIGQDGAYNDLYVVPTSNDYSNENHAMTYPTNSIAPLNDVTSPGAWSFMLPSAPSNVSKRGLKIRVHDDTSHRNVPVHKINVNSGYGDFTMIDYVPKYSLIKPDHKYTISFSGLSKGMNLTKDTYHYTTRIFNQF